MTAPRGHTPVLCAEVCAALAPRDGDVLVDGTFGAGGYARALLAAARCVIWGIDRDPSAIAGGAALAAENAGRLHLLEGCYADMEALLAARGVTRVDGVVLDIGVSSMQIDQPARGFSFQADGPLDMRMSGTGPTAADIVNQYDEAKLADLLYRLGEERKSRRIARAIVRARREAPITRTRQLARIIEQAVGPAKSASAKTASAGGKTVHPATRSFQALRIAVNDELGQLRAGLSAAERLLAPRGRLCVVSFHSLEDRIVKNFLRERCGQTPRASRHLPPDVRPGYAPTFELLFSRARKPGAAELAANPRARSARLRAAIRTNAAPWPETVNRETSA
jgi:16S rRNA (cytosine1402-N4)-methyltransferase